MSTNLINNEQKRAYIKDTLLKGKVREINKMFKEIHFADIADELEKLPLLKQVKFFKKLKLIQATQLLEELELDHQKELIENSQIKKASGRKLVTRLKVTRILYYMLKH